MIQYSVSKSDLEQLIDTEKPTWRTRARTRTNNFAQLGYYKENSSIWPEIKVVFMRLQHEKCAYCERILGAEGHSKGEHDLEHFRPKKKAKPWKLPADLRGSGINLTPPLQGNADPGYHLLAYNPLNYCTSCKTCNSNLKRDYYPIEDVRSPGGNDPVQLKSEKPLLINPVGDYDDDPETLISFFGVSSIARGNTPYKEHRGLVSIKFFLLDDTTRKELYRERAKVIVDLHSFLELKSNAPNQVVEQIYEKLVEVYTKPTAAHSSCAKCYHKLYQEDKIEADDIFIRACEYLDSISE